MKIESLTGTLVQKKSYQIHNTQLVEPTINYKKSEGIPVHQHAGIPSFQIK